MLYTTRVSTGICDPATTALSEPKSQHVVPRSTDHVSFANKFSELRERPPVGEGGLEPPHPFGHRNLNPARLPIPPLARRDA